jgi:HlyD family secretion protein
LQLESLRNGNSGALNSAYARVAQAQKELERLQAGPTQGEIDQADIAIERAQADLDDAQRTLDQMTLTAPFTGLLSAVHVEVGDLGSPGRAAVELTDLSILHVEADVDEIDIRQVHEGMPASIRLDALPDKEFAAILNRIALIGRDDDGIISYDVDVTLNEVDPLARVGMTAEAAIIVEQRENVLTIPNLYIRLDRASDQAFVNLVQPDGTLLEVEVRLGLQGQDSSEVVDGLGAGDVVAIDLSSDRISFLGG